MRKELIQEFRRSGLRFAVSISGGGSSFISEYLAEPGGSASFLEGVVPYCRAATDEYLGFCPESYASEVAARRLAGAALTRALRFSRLSGDERVDDLLGIGSTASLSTTRERRGANRAHCAIRSRFGTFSGTLSLAKNARTREEEERLVADFILSLALFAARRREESADAPWIERRERLDVETDVALTEEDAASVAWTSIDRYGADFLAGGPGESEIVALRWRAGKIDAARLRSGEEIEATGDLVAALAAKKSLAPSKKRRVLFSGSFNPIHGGHVKIAKLAEEKTSAPVALEISARNVDKAPIDPLEIARRARAIADALPDVALWTSNEPKFVDKARIFPKTTFVVGTDTILRLADPKYADDSIEKRDAILKRLAEESARFLVFARKIDGTPPTPDELRRRLPDPLLNLCEFVGPDEFLDDSSSTELRRLASERHFD